MWQCDRSDDGAGALLAVFLLLAFALITYWVASPFGQEAAASKVGNVALNTEKILSQVSEAILSNKPGSSARVDGSSKRTLEADIPARIMQTSTLVDNTTSIPLQLQLQPPNTNDLNGFEDMTQSFAHPRLGIRRESNRELLCAF